MFDLTKEVVTSSFGYHPIPGDLPSLLGLAFFEKALVLGPGVPDISEQVAETRVLVQPEVSMPLGFFWFSPDDEAPVVMVVSQGSVADAPAIHMGETLSEDHPMSRALDWFEVLWPSATAVPPPRYAFNDEVLTRSGGQDAIIRGRRFRSGQWMYDVRLDGRTHQIAERNLQPQPVLDDPETWVASMPDRADRFAATLTRAKLAGNFTDTVFSFRATRTIFRPYQFKPVMKLLSSGSLRMLVADEVGLGKTIEAGLLWTELEARRQANRVLVVCPASLVPKWKQEMEDRFNFELHELTNEVLAKLYERLEADRVPPRLSYVCSLERLRMWDKLESATELGLQFDLVIVDEAHAFRNSGTRSNALGGLISQWADALVFLSATPLNLRNTDLYNLLELLVPGEFGDLQALEDRLQPNEVLHRITESLFEPGITSDKRLAWLRDLRTLTFGHALLGRPEYAVLEEVVSKDRLSPRDVVQVKRLCSELHGLSAAVTRTRKVEVQEDKAVREPRFVQVAWTDTERAFYDSFYEWCEERAASVDMPIGFAMQMPLRLAGSCLQMAKVQVLDWQRPPDVDVAGDASETSVSTSASQSVPPGDRLLHLANALDVDTKLDALVRTVRELTAQRKQFLVFSFSRSVVGYLQTHLKAHARVAVLHGDVKKDDRLKIMADFRVGVYDLVLATRVASEGLDFEFCSAVVNYDLPWNPMEVEQRIGRIDRIGQKEEKIVVLNMHTPGTIESDIVERVMERIGVFERSIGALEPIVQSHLTDLTSAMFDFRLNSAQGERRTQEVLAAVEEQALALEDVESAASYLLSSDGVDIDGLERDLLKSGKYVGQRELALLVSDWAEITGNARVATDGDTLTLRGNAEMASQVQGVVASGERVATEVDELMARLRHESPIHLSLDQEISRTGSLPLLTANHPLTRAALRVPGHRQSRYGALTMVQPTSDVPPGQYLVLLAVASWKGLRAADEVWTAAVDLSTCRPAPREVGDAVLAQLAEGGLLDGPRAASEQLSSAVLVAQDALLEQMSVEEDVRSRENAALISTRRLSVHQVHARKLASIRERISTLRQRGKTNMIPLFDAQLRRERQRVTEVEELIRDSEACEMRLEYLAACSVEITA